MKPRFLVDSMLGSLTRWLRISGYDAEYRRDAEDNYLIEEASRTGRILLTRDRMLAQRAKKRDIEYILLEVEGDVEQLSVVAEVLGLKLGPSNSRCPKCNGTLKQTSREHVLDSVPEVSLESFDTFWVCVSCGGVYWKGSHWNQIVLTLEEADRARKNNSKSL